MKQGILGVHPDLAGRLAQRGELTTESLKEQTSAGLMGMKETEREEITRLNAKYAYYLILSSQMSD